MRLAPRPEALCVEGEGGGTPCIPAGSQRFERRGRSRAPYLLVHDEAYRQEILIRIMSKRMLKKSTEAPNWWGQLGQWAVGILGPVILRPLWWVLATGLVKGHQQR